MQQLIEAGAYLEVLQLIENIVQSIQPVSNFAVPIKRIWQYIPSAGKLSYCRFSVK